MQDEMNPVAPQNDDVQTAPVTPPPADEPISMPEETPEAEAPVVTPDAPMEE